MPDQVSKSILSSAAQPSTGAAEPLQEDPNADLLREVLRENGILTPSPPPPPNSPPTEKEEESEEEEPMLTASLEEGRKVPHLEEIEELRESGAQGPAPEELGLPNAVFSKEEVDKIVGKGAAEGAVPFDIQLPSEKPKPQAPIQIIAVPSKVGNGMTFFQVKTGVSVVVAAAGSAQGAVAAPVEAAQDTAVTSSQQQQQQQQEMEVVPSTSSGGGKEKRKRVRNRTHEGPKPQRAYQLSRDEAKDKDQRTKIRQAQNAKRTRDRQKAERKALLQENAELKKLLKEKDDLIAKIREEKRLLEAAVRGAKGGGEKRRTASTNNG